MLLGLGNFLDIVVTYDDLTDVYETPTFSIAKGKRTVTTRSNSHGSIPKDWEVVTEVSFKEPKQYGAVLKAIKALGVYLTEKDIKELKKSLKNGSSYNWDNYND